MTLELTQVAPQVKAMGQEMANRISGQDDLIEQARALLKAHATDFAELENRVGQAEKVQEGVRFSWLGAAPAGEPLDACFPPPPMPPQATVIATDGSQIHPDRHGLALYFLVNVGAIVYRHGSAERPDTHTESTLYYRESDLFTDQGLLISAGEVNVKRDMAEVALLAQLAPAYCRPDTPLISLIDGQLTLRIIDLPANQQETRRNEYIARLNELQTHGAIIAAYIDRPRGSAVLALLHLAGLEPGQITEDVLRNSPFRMLTDPDLFADLPPGHRTAIFNQRAKGNIDYARDGHAVHFFYLNTGPADAPNVVRVEIPGWVAKNPQKLNALHAVLLKQAAITAGYPYVLARAHELAIIAPDEREALETMLAVSLRRNGVPVGVSRKQANKDLLGSREGFKL